MKKKSILLSAFAAIAICVSLICGTTYALFTSESETSVAITSGKVDVKATLSIKELYSPTLINLDGTVSDATNAATKTTFFGSGTAGVTKAGDLELKNMAPGDKVTVSIAITNHSSVESKYRLVVKPANMDGDSVELFAALNFVLEGENYTNLARYKGAFARLVPGSNPNDLEASIELPTTAGNELKEKSTHVLISVEAVQGNAVTTDEVEVFHNVNNSTELLTAIKDAEEGSVLNFVATGDLDEKLAVTENKTVNLDLNGNKLMAKTPIAVTQSGSTAAVVVQSNGSLNLSNGTVDCNMANYGVFVSTLNGAVTLDNMVVSNYKTNGLRIATNAAKNVVVDHCTIESTNASATPVFLGNDQKAEVLIQNSKLIGKQAYAITNNANNKAPVDLTVKNTEISSVYAVYLPSTGNYLFENCTVTGYVVLCGGSTTIDGGTYTVKEVSSILADATNNTNGNGVYEVDEATKYFESHTSGVGCLGDVITIVDNRSSSYELGDITIKNATIQVLTQAEGNIIFGIRYHNQTPTLPGVNVTLENNKVVAPTQGTMELYSVDYFNNN